MKCGFLGLMVMCWVGLQSYAQGPDFWQFEGLDTLYRKVKGFGVGLPQEKAYLHLDNTCYFLGDTIWYKGYVTRSDRGTLTDLSFSRRTVIPWNGSSWRWKTARPTACSC